jgi:uncharacterized repeat protein (TIGR01451 family)
MPPEENGSTRSPQDDAIEHRKHDLYSRKAKTGHLNDIRTPLSPRTAEAPVAWSHAKDSSGQKKAPPLTEFTMRKTKMSFAAKFLGLSMVFFALAAGVAAWVFFGGGNVISSQNIDLQIVTPSLVDSGKEATFQVIITNRNSSQLTLADLITTYPDGTRDPNNPTQPLTNSRQTVGTIAPGASIKETVSGVFYGAEGAAEQVSVTLDYSVPGSNAVFQKQASASFTIGSSPVALTVSAPDTTTSGQQFSIDITVQNNSTAPLQNVVVQGQYPFGWSVGSASPAAVAGGTFWRLGSLSPGQSQTVHLTGTLVGADGDARIFRFLVGSNTDPTNTTVEVPLLTVPQTVTVEKPFVSGSISVNGQTGKVIAAPAGQALTGTIEWQNNLAVSLTNVTLTLTLGGPALDLSSIGSPSGFYQSQNSTITWTPQQNPSLASVPPGGTGEVSFNFASLPPGANQTLITNPLISLNLTVSGTRSDGSAPVTVSSAAQAQVSVASTVALSAQALHLSSPVPVGGPLPPKVGSQTAYAVVWSVKNSSNDVGNATVSTVLPPYADFSPAGASSGISYDQGSRTVTWSLGDLAQGVGYSSPARQAYFEVVLTPSSSQVGTAPALTGAAELQGQDRFAQVSVSATAQAPTTQLSEPGFGAGQGLVAQ